MKYTIKRIDGIAIIDSREAIITDAASALDLIASVSYEYGVSKAIIRKESICDDFFKLSTGTAGEVVQKFVNYRFTLAIVGDFSGYTSKPLHDYIYECNKGRHLFFVANEQEALAKLGSA